MSLVRAGSAAGVSARVLGHSGFVVRVTSNAAAALVWLEEFLAPSFRPIADEEPALLRGSGEAPRVSFTADAERLTAAVEGARPLDAMAECFTMDREHVRWPLYQASGGESFACSTSEGIALWRRECPDGIPPDVELLTAADNRSARLALMRTVRELAMQDGRRQRRLLLHAAAVAADGEVTLIIGPKRSGKSSMLVHALQHDGVRYVANDRVLVDPQTGRAWGVPTIVRLRPAMLDFFPALRARTVNRVWQLDRSRAEHASAPIDAGAVARGGLSPAQFLDVLGAAAVDGGIVRRIVFPSIGDPAATPRFALRRLDPSAVAVRLLERGLLAAGRPASYLAAPAASGDEEAMLPVAAEALASRVDGLEGVLGPAAYERPGVWEAIGCSPQ